jgi:hypothetical protein
MGSCETERSPTYRQEEAKSEPINGRGVNYAALAGRMEGRWLFLSCLIFSSHLISTIPLSFFI